MLSRAESTEPVSRMGSTEKNLAEREHVVLVTNSLEPGGTERNIIALSTNLSGQFVPEIWSLKAAEGDVVGDVPVRVFRRLLKLDPLLVLRIAAAMSQHPARVFHVFHFALGVHVALASLLLLLGRKRLVFSFGSGRNFISSGVFSWYARLVNATASCITFNSNSTRRALAGDGISRECCEVVVNGHDTRPFQTLPTAEQCRNHLGINAADRLVVTTGRLIESKRVRDLVDATSIGSDWTLVVIGDGPLRDELQQQVTNLGIEHRVRFTGMLQKPEMLMYLGAADVFAFASETEGLPNSLIEAALAGLPIVACNVEGVVDVIEDGRNGILVPARDPQSLNQAIIRCLGDVELSRALGSEAREQAMTQYSLEQMVKTFERIYRDCG